MSSGERRPVVITGIGLLSAAGEGAEPHRAALANGKPLGLTSEGFAPYTVHALQEPDWANQIGRRDMRQMEPWQRIGTYAAGLALDDADAKHENLLDTMDMIVAAGGGERDIEVDNAVMAAVREGGEPDATVNERLPNDLRPTLFLAQLSNLLAGNISIVHKVTGSSRTFMGEEGAGMSAIATAHARISSGQSDMILVGGAFNGEREDMLLLFELGNVLSHGDGLVPVGERNGKDAGFHLGSVGAFMVMESAESAQKRGAKAYCELTAVNAAHGPRSDDALKKRLVELAKDTDIGETTPTLSTCTGLPELHKTESALLQGRPVRNIGTVFGHGVEAQFPLAVALAALELQKPTSFEKTSQVAVSAVGAWRSEAMALLSKTDEGDAR